MNKGRKKRKPKALPPGVVRTQKELADVLNVAPKTIEYWRKAGMPRHESGGYSIVDTLEWRRLRDAAAQGAEGDGSTKEGSLTARNMRLDAELKEEKLHALRSKTMPQSQVKTLLILRAAELRKSLIAEGRRLAPRLEGKKQAQIRKLYEAAISRILDTYSSDPTVVKS